MDKEIKITPEQLSKAMDADYQKLVQLVSGAVNGAPDGAVISGSEELVRDAMARFRQKVYEKAIQLRTQAAQAANGRLTGTCKMPLPRNRQKTISHPHPSMAEFALDKITPIRYLFLLSVYFLSQF